MGARQARGATGSDGPRARRAISCARLTDCTRVLQYSTVGLCLPRVHRSSDTPDSVDCVLWGGGARACAGEYALTVI